MHEVSLPDKILYSSFDSDWDAFIEAAYDVFKRDFVYSKPIVPNRRVALKKHPQSLEKEATFWHLTSEGKKEEDRIPDIRRTECITWIKPIIEGYAASNLRCWEKIHRTRKGPEKRIMICTENFDYIVVLADRTEYLLPWTAYPIQHDSQKMKYKNEYETFRKGLGPHCSYDPFTPSTTR